MALGAGVATSVAGAWRTVVSLGAAGASSSTSIASRPLLVMRSAIGPLSSSRRQTGSEPPARTSSSRPARTSLSTTLRATSRPPAVQLRESSRCEAADRMTSCVSVSLAIGILRWGWCGVVAANHHSPTLAMQPAGQDPEARPVPGTVTLPLCSRANGQSFLDNVIAGLRWSEHGMIPTAFAHLPGQRDSAGPSCVYA
jgi:hypothetical protein